MTTAATSLLGLALPVTGELAGTWGTTVNDSITSLLDTAVAGTTTLSTDADVTLTTTTLAANQARQAILLCSGARTALRTITAPAQSKIYTIINATTGGFSVKLVGVGPTTGLTIPNGASAVVAWNGSDFIEVGSATVGNLTVNGNLSVTGTTSLTGVATLTANPVLSAGTANGVAYLNGSKVVTTGSALTFNASTLAIATAANDQLTWTAGRTGYLYADSAGVAIGDTALLAGNNTYYNKTSNYIANYINGSEQMRLTSTGLGIGTSSPGTKLHVTGSNGLFVQFLNSANNTGEGLVFGSGSNLGRMSTNGANTAMAFEINGVERMRLDSSGNLGLGVTPSAWNAGSPVIQMAGGTSIYADSNQTVYGLNAAYISGWKYVLSDYATQYNQVNGQHQWYNAPSGTAGNAISFTQAMTLDASGNLGVGTTSLGSFRFKAIGTGGNLSGNAYYVGLVGEGAASNKGVGFGYDSSSQTGVIYSETASSASNLAFWTYSGSAWGERARITSGGYFKASNTGTYQSSTATYHELYNDANSNTVRITNAKTSGFTDAVVQVSFNQYAPNDGTAVFLWCNDTSAVRTKILSNGGLANYSANDVNLSDRREKTNFAPAGNYLAKICAIPVQTFNYIDQSEDDPGLTLGVVAQDVQAVAPELVSESNWGTEEEPKMRLSIYQTDLQYALMKCIQEQQAIIEQLKADVAALKGN